MTINPAHNGQNTNGDESQGQYEKGIKHRGPKMTILKQKGP